MNLLDVLILVAVLAGLAGGYRRGLWLTLMQYAGMLGGIIAGAWLAPRMVDRIGADDPTERQIAALLVIVVTSGLGGSLGFWLGGSFRRWLLRRRLLGALDSAFGALFSAGLTLAAAWLFAAAFARGPVPEVAKAIQTSLIVGRLDAVAPEPPAFVARVQQVLSGTFLPSIFAGLQPNLPDPVEPSPDSATTVGVRTAAASTVKIEGTGCGGISSGSGFPVGNDLFVTNAHVVSGTGRPTIIERNGRRHAASVVLFDPEVDIAVVRAPGLAIPPLAAGEAGANTPGAVIGYPGGGPLRVSAAVVQQELRARGRDIYNDRITVRDIWVVSAEVRPGNSGGPLVGEDGRWVGVVFGASVTDPNQGFALARSEVDPEIARAMSATGVIDTRKFACAR